MKNTEVLGLLGMVTGAIAVGYSIYVSNKMNKLCAMLDTTVAKLASETVVDVSPAIVDRAVECAVDLAVGKAIKSATASVVQDIKYDIKKEVAKAIDTEYTNIRPSVATEVKKQVADLDISKMKSEVREQAKAKVLEKFEGNLQDILDDFNTNLQSVKKIYGSIADTLSDNKKETVVKIG